MSETRHEEEIRARYATYKKPQATATKTVGAELKMEERLGCGRDRPPTFAKQRRWMLVASPSSKEMGCVLRNDGYLTEMLKALRCGGAS